MINKNLQQLANKAKSKADLMYLLKITINTGGYKKLNTIISNYNLDITHFSSKRSFNNKQNLKDILVEKSRFNSSRLKTRLYKEGLKKEQCEICGQNNTWNGKNLVLTLDHINGNHFDNRLENLRIVCPNCDRQLPTFGAKNIQRLYKICTCGAKIKSVKRLFCSRSCYFSNKNSLNTVKNGHLKQRKVVRPSYEELLKCLTNKSFLEVGRLYNVSDNSIRKWVKQYEKELQRA